MCKKIKIVNARPKDKETYYQIKKETDKSAKTQEYFFQGNAEIVEVINLKTNNF